VKANHRTAGCSEIGILPVSAAAFKGETISDQKYAEQFLQARAAPGRTLILLFAIGGSAPRHFE